MTEEGASNTLKDLTAPTSASSVPTRRAGSPAPISPFLIDELMCDALGDIIAEFPRHPDPIGAVTAIDALLFLCPFGTASRRGSNPLNIPFRGERP